RGATVDNKRTTSGVSFPANSEFLIHFNRERGLEPSTDWLKCPLNPQKRTFRAAIGMSALHAKADAHQYVSLVRLIIAG
ncbi:MAG: hypothetical protein WCF47_13205, partial [Pseudolabrys sp.]